VRDRLQRLAQPHVVGEHAAESEPAELLEPGQAPLLVGAERRREAGEPDPRRRREERFALHPQRRRALPGRPGDVVLERAAEARHRCGPGAVDRQAAVGQ